MEVGLRLSTESQIKRGIVIEGTLARTVYVPNRTYEGAEQISQDE